MEIGKIYFWTATIKQWQPLLLPDIFKDIIISSLGFLANKKLIDVFGFVIMPNHIHLIWRMNQLNGKEMPSSSLLKYTAHQFKKRLSPDELKQYSVTASNKQHKFWQRDSLAIELYTPEVVYQKLEYIHLNPLADHWALVKEPYDYLYSSASFYETSDIRFQFLRHVNEVL